MKNKVMKLLISLLIGISAEAIDLRLVGGAMLSDSVYISKSKSIGVSVSGYTDTKRSGVAYGVNLAAITSNFKQDEGAYVNLNFEILYRIKRNTEPYIVFGGVFQNLSNDDYGFGYSYGAGIRYVYCNGWQLGAEFIEHDLTFNSGRASSARFNNQEYSNHNLNAYIGYRF